MKLKIVFLAFLCFYNWKVLYAQTPTPTPKTPAAQGLKVGDHVPDLLLRHLSGFTRKGHTGTAVHLSDFHGQLVLLDFWATWCAPCRMMIPVLDSLQQTFAGKLTILPVTYQPLNVVQPVLTAIHKGKAAPLPVLTQDTILHRLFPHRSLPHEVWIDAEGIVQAITGYEEVTAANIEKLLARQHLNTAQKRDSVQAYDPARPLLAGGNGGDGTSLQYHSLLTGFIPGLTGGLTVSPFDPVKGQQFSVRNAPFTWLCRLAFAGDGRWFSDARIRLLSKDSARLTTSLSGQAYESWLADQKGYCYELKVPPNLAAQAFTFIRQDLTRLFPQYQVSVQQQPAPVLALVRTSTHDQLRTKGGPLEVEVSPYEAHLHNAHLSQLVMRLDRQYLQDLNVPLVDETGYTGRIDLDLKASLSNIDELNRALAPYELQLVRKTTMTDFLIIADAPDHTPLTQPQPLYP